MKTNTTLGSFGAALIFLTAAASAPAATYLVDSISALQTRINSAVAGDLIIVENGTYTTSAAITVNRTGTAANPIIIAAESIGGVTIAGSHGFTVNSPATYIEIEGFRFTHTSGRNAINSGATHIRFTRNVFQCPGDGNHLLVAGHDAEIDRNEFRNKSTVGNMIDVRGSGSQIAQRVWIHHNYFHDFASAGANGAETIRFGLSGLSLSNGFGLIEHNLFVRCVGENELISIKASANTIRYNTILESPGTQLTQRHGNDCLIYGNYLRDTDGIRIFGDRHQVFSNYLEGNSGGINLGNGDGEVADGAPLTSHDRPDDCVITFNTLLNNTRHYFMSGRTNGLGATGTVFANNIIQGGGEAADIAGPNSGAVWSGNILWNTAGAGDMPSGGYTTVNPLLAADADGVFHLQSGSPAINTATGTYSVVTVDMDGQPRSGSKDKGADEFSTAAVTARLLTSADVGPNSGLGGGATKFSIPGSAVIASADDGNVPANTVDGDLGTRWSANGDGQWIRYDLGSSNTVSFVKIAFYNGSVRTSDFDIQVSSNGSSWTTVASPTSSGTTTALETFDLTDVSARYVRILGHGNSVNLWNSYTEVEIWGTPSAAPGKLTSSGTPVLASADDGNVPANTLDGNLATRWSANGDGQWIRYDLGSTKTVSFVKIAFYNGSARTSDFDVQVSSNGTSWTTISSHTSSGTTTALETFDFADTAARYVRILGHGNSVNLWNSYTEVEVWGL